MSVAIAVAAAVVFGCKVIRDVTSGDAAVAPPTHRLPLGART